jgi:hypothetical protein
MSKRIVGMILCLMMALPAFSMHALAAPDTELEIQIMGGLPLPLFLHLVGGVIGNIGNTTAYNVSYTLTIDGGILDGIHKTSEGFEEEILPGTGWGVFLNDVYGFGLVDIVLTVSASNAQNATGSAKGVQLREFTWVPFSWISSLKK